MDRIKFTHELHVLNTSYKILIKMHKNTNTKTHCSNLLKRAEI